MNNITIKQHYIPRFFLERFADDSGKLFVYNVKQDKEYEAYYESLGFENNLYETKWEKPNSKLGKYILQNDIEHILAEYDGEFSAFLHDLDKRIISDQNPNALICNKQEKSVLKRLIANFIFRNPATMRMVDSEERLQNIMSNEDIKMFLEVMDLMRLGGGKSIVEAAVKKVTVTEEIEGGRSRRFIESISGIPFMFLFSKSGGFMISDVPVSVGIDEMIEGGNNQCVYLPLCSRYAVLFGNYTNIKNNRIIFLDDAIANEFVDEYIKKNIEHGNKLYFQNRKQRSLVVSRIKEGYYGEI